MKDIEYKSEKYAKYLEEIIKTYPITIQYAIDKKLEIPVVYIITDFNDNVIWVGDTKNFYSCMYIHGYKRKGIQKKIHKSLAKIRKYKVRQCNIDDDRQRYLLKKYIYAVLKPLNF